VDTQPNLIKIDSYDPEAGVKRCNVHELYPRLWAIGSVEILDNPLLGFFCSVKCRGEVILRVYDLARNLRGAGVTVIGGFHSPLEKDCLDPLMRGTQPIVICPARSIKNMRIPSAWKEPLTQGRLLILSPFESKYRRVTATLAEERNRLVMALSDKVFVAYATTGGKTEQLCQQILDTGKPLYTLDLKENEHLMKAGAIGVAANDVIEFLANS